MFTVTHDSEPTPEHHPVLNSHFHVRCTFKLGFLVFRSIARILGIFQKRHFKSCLHCWWAASRKLTQFIYEDYLFGHEVVEFYSKLLMFRRILNVSMFNVKESKPNKPPQQELWNPQILYAKQKQTPWLESACELYRPSDLRLSAKLVPTLADRWCRVVSATNPQGR
jgi:hypothetical protein